MKILDKLDYIPDFSYQREFLAKDFSYNRIINLKPDFKDAIDTLESSLDRKRYLSIDLQEKILDTGNPTCKRAIWHVDGIGNNYVIVCWGEFRTLFMNNLLPFDRQETILKTSDHIHSRYKDLPSHNYFEIPEGSPVVYTSENIHSGQIVKSPSKRILLRLCYSDYIRPNNILFKSFKR